jgi:ABC-type multidrug transport system fused ATPase/permease subunit
MESLTDGRTTIVDAHRLPPIERADRIAALDRYAKLPRIQFATATAVV